MRPVSMSHLLTLTLLGMAATAASAEPADNPDRPGLDLNGTWSFRLDPDNVGEREEWFHDAAGFPHSIQVPGAWDAQGFGPETEKLHHNFIGKGWYARTVDLPEDWKDRRIFLRFGGVYRAARVWVNGTHVGDHIGYVSAFEFDITPAVRFGQPNHVTVLVDSEQYWDRDALQGCMDIIDHLFTYWGGLWGRVTLEARDQAWMKDVFLAPRTTPEPGCVVTAQVAGDPGQAASVEVSIVDGEGNEVAAAQAPVGDDGAIRLDVAMPDAQLWTPEIPHLYTAVLTLRDGDGTERDRVRDRFGVRSIELRDTDFYVNGVKYYLAGYGDDCVYPDTIAPPADKDFYVERLRVAKSYGFNYVRHHSHFVAPEYYEACDEVGMFVSPELPIGYPRFYNRAHGAALELYKTEWAGVIKRYRNHPSIFDWCMSNELWEGMPRIGPDLYRIAKELDPTRPVIDSDGLFSGGFIDGTKDRDTLDFLTVMFDILTTPFDNPEKFATGTPLKPMITHEEGNFVHFPRLDEIELYTQFKPFWLTDCRDRVARAGLLDEALAWSEASERLYLLCHKANIEALRKNPRISGYHWWLLQPWYVGSNGLVDVHRRPIAVSPEEVRRFNGPVVLLQEGIGSTYGGGQELEFQLLLSNYSGSSIEGGSVEVTVTVNDEAVETRALDVASLENGSIGEVGSVRVSLPDTAEATQFRVEARLTSSAAEQSNAWTAWLFPSKEPASSADVPLYASADLEELLKPFGAQPMPEQIQSGVPAVYVARQPTEALVRAAEAGACVVLLSPAGVFPTDYTAFKPAWWLGVFENDSNAGTYVYDNPVTRGLTPEGWCDDSWFHLLQGAQTFLLDDLPVQPEVLIRALNTHGAPHGFSRYVDFEFVWRNKALLMQAKVGAGSVVLSGLNFDYALERGGPEGPYVLRRLLDHAKSRPQPKAEWTAEYLLDLVARSPFARGPLVPGFSRIVFHKGETAQGQSFRDRTMETLRIRQEEPLHRVAWETGTVPEAPFVTFVFAGTLPFSAPPSAPPGFTLTVNGRRAVDFDTVRQQTRWDGDGNGCSLLYVPSHVRPSWSETAGLFYLSVPAEFLTPESAATLEVRARGSDPGRWFGLQPYTDTLPDAR